MTEEQYWRGDPNLVVAYMKAQRMKDDRKNQELWLQGVYIYSAFSTVISNAFGKPGTKQKYFEEPIDLHPEETNARKIAEARQKVVDQLNAWKQAWERNQQENGDQSDS